MRFHGSAREICYYKYLNLLGAKMACFRCKYTPARTHTCVPGDLSFSSNKCIGKTCFIQFNLRKKFTATLKKRVIRCSYMPKSFQSITINSIIKLGISLSLIWMNASSFHFIWEMARNNDTNRNARNIKILINFVFISNSFES